MPFIRPSVAELIDRVRGDIRGRLEIEGPLLRRAMADVLGAVWGGSVHTLYGYLDWLSKQLFGDTAEREQLLRMAALYGISPIAATYATGTVTAVGTLGTITPAGTIIRLDAATSYRVTADTAVVAFGYGFGIGAAALPVVAVLAGVAGNIPAATALAYESPIPGIGSVVTVATGGIVGGNEAESTEALRARYLLRLRQPPQGGADQDYKAWSLAVAGVTRAWTYPNELGLGTVVVRFVRDDDATGGIFPDAGEVAAVQAALDAQRPITATVTAVAPTSLAVAFTIHPIPDTTATRASITAELTDLLRRVAEPGDGLGRGKVLISQMRTSVGVAAGVTDYALTVPAADVVPGVGQLPVVGTITWV